MPVVDVKPFYRLSEIATWIGYTRDGCHKALVKLRVPINKIGRWSVVYLSDLRTYAPDLYDSILEANHLKALIDDTTLTDDDG